MLYNWNKKLSEDDNIYYMYTSFVLLICHVLYNANTYEGNVQSISYGILSAKF